MNMAIDEAMLRLRGETGVDTLRVYMWLPGGLSLGRRQSVGEVNLAEAESRGYVLVRRPTGGAALLHPAWGEVTYSVVLSQSHPLARLSVDESAAMIARGIALAVERLGADAGVGGFKGTARGGLCYVRPGSSDVVVAGRKISGSAQLRAHGALLQHGTLLLRFDPEEWLSVIPVEGMTPKTLASKVAGLYDLLGREVPLARVVEELVRGMAEALGYGDDWREGSLTPRELQLAAQLYKLKYGNSRWNLMGESPEPT
jgi:lipoate-protein ligase A